MSIQTKHVFADLLSVGLSAALVFGYGVLQDFAFFVLLAFVFLGWAVLLGGGVRDEAAQMIRDRVWWSGFLSFVQIASLIYAGHPIVAALSLVLSMLIVGCAFKEQAA